MITELYRARGVLEGRIHSDQDAALLRSVELARESERRTRRQRHRSR